MTYFDNNFTQILHAKLSESLRAVGVSKIEGERES